MIHFPTSQELFFTHTDLEKIKKNKPLNSIENGANKKINTNLFSVSSLPFSVTGRKIKKNPRLSPLPYKISTLHEKVLKKSLAEKSNSPFLFRPFSGTFSPHLAIKENYWKKVFREGNMELARMFLKSGIDKNHRFSDGHSPLSIACENEHIEIVKMLIGHGAIKHTKNAANQTPLMIACQNGNRLIAELLMIDQKSGKLYIPPGDKNAILDILLTNGNTEIFRLLLDEMTEVDINHSREGYKHNFMVTCCINGNLPLLRLLKEKGGDLHFSRKGKTLLTIACQNQNREIVNFLLKNYVSTDFKNFHTQIYPTALGIACEKNSLEIVQLLVESHADLEKGSHQEPPLVIASKIGNPEIVKYLLDQGSQIEKRDYEGNTPLIKAVQKNHLPIIHLLIERGADVNAFNGREETPLTIACRQNQNELVDLLLQKGAQIEGTRKRKKSPLIIACENENEELIHLLLDKGALFNYPHYLENPLTTCCQNGNLSLVELFISKTALIREPTELIKTAYKYGHLHLIEYFLDRYKIGFFQQQQLYEIVLWMCQKRDFSAIRLFLNAGLDLNACHFTSPLPFPNIQTLLNKIIKEDSSEQEKIETLRFLLENGMNVNLKYNEASCTALHTACSKQHIEIVKFLLQFGADVSLLNGAKQTPLHIACYKGNLELVRTLLIYSDNAKEADYAGNNCLIAAVESQNVEVVLLILDCNIGIETENEKGETALDIACLQDHPVSIIQILLAKGANANRFNHQDKSLFLRVCEYKRFNVAQLFIDQGIDINARNKKNETALDYFYQKRMDSVILFLRKNQAKTASEIDAF